MVVDVRESGLDTGVRTQSVDYNGLAAQVEVHG